MGVQMFKVLAIGFAFLISSGLALAQTVEFPEKTRKIYGEETLGGDNYEDASAAPIGTEFRLTHHQDKGYFDYFYVDLEANQRVEVSVKTGELGLRRGKETSNCGAGIQLHNSERIRIGRKRVNGCHYRESISYIASKPERFYLLVGDQHRQIHKDFVFYKVETSKLEDSIENNSLLEPQEISFDTEFEGILSRDKDTFYYSLQGSAGQKIRVRVRSEEGAKFSVSATLKSDVGQIFESAIAQGVGSAASPEIELPVDGNYMLQVRCARRIKRVLDQPVPKGRCFSSSSNKRGEVKDFAVVVETISKAEKDVHSVLEEKQNAANAEEYSDSDNSVTELSGEPVSTQ